MILKTYLNKYGLMIYKNSKCNLIFYNGMCLKLYNRKVKLSEFDSNMFYELLRKK